MRRKALILVSILAVGGCTLTPDYERPELDVPQDFVQSDPAGESIANIEWWDLFQDEQLQQLINTALEENKDLGVALTRIESARQAVTVVRANRSAAREASTPCSVQRAAAEPGGTASASQRNPFCSSFLTV